MIHTPLRCTLVPGAKTSEWPYNWTCMTDLLKTTYLKEKNEINIFNKVFSKILAILYHSVKNNNYSYLQV